MLLVHSPCILHMNEHRNEIRMLCHRTRGTALLYHQILQLETIKTIKAKLLINIKIH